MAKLNNRLIAGVRTKTEFVSALNSPCEIIFLLNFQNILNIEEVLTLTHKAGKKAYIHFDFLDGVGKDKYGLKYIKSKGADGIITTKTNIVMMAKEEGLSTVQRFFIVDSKAIGTALDAIHSSNPDMVEIMPGIIPKVILGFAKKIKQPIIAGGLISTKEEIKSAINSGATAISTGKEELWYE
ncbi:MAG: glycerol-3-phosphate responsive antiterminator [Clostridia bacterium]|nr:glycerol-3-phosphate responsive antiterminator [Clostridia bacterium]